MKIGFFVALFFVFFNGLYATEPNGFASYFDKIVYQKFIEKEKEKALLKDKKEKERLDLLKKKEEEKRAREQKRSQMVGVENLKKEMVSAVVEKTLNTFPSQDHLPIDENFHDFETDGHAYSEEKNEIEGETSYQLNGVILFEDKKKALINNQIFSLGDFVDEYTKLVDIQSQCVVLSRGDRKFTVEIPSLEANSAQNKGKMDSPEYAEL